MPFMPKPNTLPPLPDATRATTLSSKDTVDRLPKVAEPKCAKCAVDFVPVVVTVPDHLPMCSAVALKPQYPVMSTAATCLKLPDVVVTAPLSYMSNQEERKLEASNVITLAASNDVSCARLPPINQCVPLKSLFETRRPIAAHGVVPPAQVMVRRLASAYIRVTEELPVRLDKK